LDKLDKLVESEQISKYEWTKGSFTQSLTLYFPNGLILTIDSSPMDYQSGIMEYNTSELDIY
jgi:hypothetical protein